MGLFDFFKKKPKATGANVSTAVSRVVRTKQSGGMSTNAPSGGGAAGAAGTRLSAQQKAREAQYERLKKRQISTPVFHAVNNAAKTSRESKPTATAAMNEIRKTTSTRSSSDYLQQAYEFSKKAALRDVTARTIEDDRARKNPSTNAEKALAGLGGDEYGMGGRSLYRRGDSAGTVKNLTEHSREYRKKVDAGVNNGGIHAMRAQTPTEEELGYRQEYGYDQAAKERILNMANSEKDFGGINLGRAGMGFEESYNPMKYEKFLKEQYGIDLTDEEQAQIDEARSSKSYGAGYMAGEGSQFLLTAPLAAPLEGAIAAKMGIQGAGRGARVLKGLMNSKDARKAAAAFVASQEILSAPINFFDALKQDDWHDILVRYAENQGLDLLFAGVMSVPGLRRNLKFVKAWQKNNEANRLMISDPARARQLWRESLDELKGLSDKTKDEAIRYLAEDTSNIARANNAVRGEFQDMMAGVRNRRANAEQAARDAEYLRNRQPMLDAPAQRALLDEPERQARLGAPEQRAVLGNPERRELLNRPPEWMNIDEAANNLAENYRYVDYTDEKHLGETNYDIEHAAELDNLNNAELRAAETPAQVPPRGEPFSPEEMAVDAAERGDERIIDVGDADLTDEERAYVQLVDDTFRQETARKAATDNTSWRDLYLEAHKSGKQSTAADIEWLERAENRHIELEGLELNPEEFAVWRRAYNDALKDLRGPNRFEEAEKIADEAVLKRWQKFDEPLVINNKVSERQQKILQKKHDEGAADLAKRRAERDSRVADSAPTEAPQESPAAEIPERPKRRGATKVDPDSLERPDFSPANEERYEAYARYINDRIAANQRNGYPDSLARNYQVEQPQQPPKSNLQRMLEDAKAEKDARKAANEAKQATQNSAEPTSSTRESAANDLAEKNRYIDYTSEERLGEPYYDEATDVAGRYDEAANDLAENRRYIDYTSEERLGEPYYDDATAGKTTGPETDADWRDAVKKIIRRGKQTKNPEKKAALRDETMSLLKSGDSLVEVNGAKLSKPEKALWRETFTKAMKEKSPGAAMKDADAAVVEFRTRAANPDSAEAAIEKSAKKQTLKAAKGETEPDNLPEFDQELYDDVTKWYGRDPYERYETPYYEDEAMDVASRYDEAANDLAEKRRYVDYTSEERLGEPYYGDEAADTVGRYDEAANDLAEERRYTDYTSEERLGEPYYGDEVEETLTRRPDRLPAPEERRLLPSPSEEPKAALKEGPPKLRDSTRSDALFDELEDINESTTGAAARRTEPYPEPRVVTEDFDDAMKYAKEGARQERTLGKLGKQHGTHENNIPKKNLKGQEISQAEATARSSMTPEEQFEQGRDILSGASGTKNSQKVKDVKATVEERWEANPEGQRKILDKELAAMRDAKLKGRIYHPKHFESVQEMMESVEHGLVRGRKAAEAARKAGDYELEADLVQQNYQLHELRVQAASEAGATLRQYREYIKASPEAMRTLIQREVDQIAERYAKQLRKHGIKEIKIRDDLVQRIINAKNDEEAASATKELALDIWNQVPASLKEKLDAWRMTAMLLNPRTHVRNLAGNAFFKPFYKISDKLTYLGEQHLVKTGRLNKSETTRAILDRSNPNDLKLIEWARKYFDDNADILRGENKYYEDFGGVRRRPMEGITIKNADGTTTKVKSKIFTAGKDDPNALAKAIDSAHDFNASMLDKEDIHFMRQRFTDMYAQRLKARGLDPTTAAQSELDDAIEGALNDALKSVYRDGNKAAEIVNKWRRVTPNDSTLRKGAAWAVDTTMPFVKTPINILRRSWEYSPGGVIQGGVRLNRALKSGDAKAVTAALNELTSGMTGTAVAVMGGALASMGFVTGKIEDNDKGWYEKDLGKQNYAIRLGTEEDGFTYTLDWAAPMAIPFFTGITMYEAWRDMKENGRPDVGTLLEAIGQTFDPTMEMSVLQGISNAFEAVTRGDSAGDAAVDLGLTTALNYLGQFNPTLHGQIARTIDPTRRDTSSTADSQTTRTIEKWWNKQIAKTPFFSTTLNPYRNVWGDEETTNRAWAAVENFLSPGYASRLRYDMIDHEINRVNEGIAEEDQVYPTKFLGRDITYHDEKLHLSAKERNYYQMVQGNSSRERLENLFASEDYRKASDSEKREMIQTELTEAGKDAKRKVLIDQKGYDAWDVYTDGMAKGKLEQASAAKKTGMSAMDYYNYVSTDVDKLYGDDSGRVSQEEAKAYLDTLDLPNSTKAILWKSFNARWADRNNPYGSGYAASSSGSGSKSKSGKSGGKSGGKSSGRYSSSSRSSSRKSSGGTSSAKTLKFSDFSKYNLDFTNMTKSNRTALIKLIQQTSKKA